MEVQAFDTHSGFYRRVIVPDYLWESSKFVLTEGKLPESVSYSSLLDIIARCNAHKSHCDVVKAAEILGIPETILPLKNIVEQSNVFETVYQCILDTKFTTYYPDRQISFVTEETTLAECERKQSFILGQCNKLSKSLREKGVNSAVVKFSVALALNLQYNDVHNSFNFLRSNKKGVFLLANSSEEMSVRTEGLLIPEIDFVVEDEEKGGSQLKDELPDLVHSFDENKMTFFISSFSLESIDQNLFPANTFRASPMNYTNDELFEKVAF